MTVATRFVAITTALSTLYVIYLIGIEIGGNVVAQSVGLRAGIACLFLSIGIRMIQALWAAWEIQVFRPSTITVKVNSSAFRLLALQVVPAMVIFLLALHLLSYLGRPNVFLYLGLQALALCTLSADLIVSRVLDLRPRLLRQVWHRWRRIKNWSWRDGGGRTPCARR